MPSALTSMPKKNNHGSTVMLYIWWYETGVVYYELKPLLRNVIDYTSRAILSFIWYSSVLNFDWMSAGHSGLPIPPNTQKTYLTVNPGWETVCGAVLLPFDYDRF